MITKWHSHLKNDEDKELFIRKILSSKEVFDRLMSILKEEEAQLDRSELDVRTYDLPNWDYRQADKNGFRRCLNIMKKLIDLDQKEN